MARYPYAMALKGALRSYAVARELITPELEPLVMSYLKNIRESVAEAFGVSLNGSSRGSSSRRIRWGGKEIAAWVAGLTELVTLFEERVETLLQACDKINSQLILLNEIDYDKQAFMDAVGGIQKIVDELSLAGYTELKSWVTVVNKNIGSILLNRLETALKNWSYTLELKAGTDGVEDTDEQKEKLGSVVKIPAIGVELLLRNQEISASPALPQLRSVFLKELHDYIGVVCTLPSPASGRFEVFDSPDSINDTSAPGTFSYLVDDVDSSLLARAYGCIELHMYDVSNFVSQWFAYQALWDTRVSDVASAIGKDMNLWHSVLNEAAAARNALDSSMKSSDFGPITVYVEKVQSQINLKYDLWQKELHSCYAEVLGQKIEVLHNNVVESKTKLEDIALEGGAATVDVVLGVTFIQETKEKLTVWSDEVNVLLEAERLLKRQRHVFHSDWMEGSRLQGQFEQLEQIFARRSRAMNEQLPLLQARVVSEDKVADQRNLALVENWDEEKPLRGNMLPRVALELLSKYEFTMKKAKTDDENLIKAKDALGLDAAISNSDIASCFEELCDLKEVWNAVSDPYDALDKIKETPWVTAVTRKIRKELDNLLSGKQSNASALHFFLDIH